jgi:hypothetical protein
VVEEIVSPENERLIYSRGPDAQGNEPGWERFQGSIAKKNDENFLTYETIKRGTLMLTMKGDKLICWAGIFRSKSMIEMTRRP